MDNYFKAAVCDLDKLLDDFELSSGWKIRPLFPLYTVASCEIVIHSYTPRLLFVIGNKMGGGGIPGGRIHDGVI